MKSRVQIEIIDPKAREKATPGSNWHPGDFEFFDSRKAMSKVRRNLNALPHLFNITVLVGDLSEGRKLIAEQPVYDDMINVVYCNNVTTARNWIPMTSWILLHRISHSIVTGGPMFDQHYTSLDGPEFNLLCGLDELWHLVYRDRGLMRSRYVGANGANSFSCLSLENDSPAAGFLANHLFTMRSAREKALSNELDIFAEAFAQFLHTGRFRLNRWAESGIEDVGHTDNFPRSSRSQMEWGRNLRQDLRHRLAPVEALDEKIAQIEQDVNNRMAELATRMVGHQFSF